ncbi:unnamed protein product [Urochloa humidicola]
MWRRAELSDSRAAGTSRNRYSDEARAKLLRGGPVIPHRLGARGAPLRHQPRLIRICGSRLVRFLSKAVMPFQFILISAGSLGFASRWIYSWVGGSLWPRSRQGQYQDGRFACGGNCKGTAATSRISVWSATKYALVLKVVIYAGTQKTNTQAAMASEADDQVTSKLDDMDGKTRRGKITSSSDSLFEK